MSQAGMDVSDAQKWKLVPTTPVERPQTNSKNATAATAPITAAAKHLGRSESSARTATNPQRLQQGVPLVRLGAQETGRQHEGDDHREEDHRQ